MPQDRQRPARQQPRIAWSRADQRHVAFHEITFLFVLSSSKDEPVHRGR